MLFVALGSGTVAQRRRGNAAGFTRRHVRAYGGLGDSSVMLHGRVVPHPCSLRSGGPAPLPGKKMKKRTGSFAGGWTRGPALALGWLARRPWPHSRRRMCWALLSRRVETDRQRRHLGKQSAPAQSAPKRSWEWMIRGEESSGRRPNGHWSEGRPSSRNVRHMCTQIAQRIPARQFDRTALERDPQQDKVVAAEVAVMGGGEAAGRCQWRWRRSSGRGRRDGPGGGGRQAAKSKFTHPNTSLTDSSRSRWPFQGGRLFGQVAALQGDYLAHGAGRRKKVG